MSYIATILLKARQKHMKNRIYKKKLCMTEFHIVKMHYSSPQYFDACGGVGNSAFVFVVCGSVTVNSPQGSIHAEEGELIFLPEGLRFSAAWRGSPEIEYYSLRIISKQVNVSESAAGFALQRVELPAELDVGDMIAEIYRLFESEERINMLRGLGIYYNFYAEALPLLKQAESRIYSSITVTATKYIDNHFAEDFSVDELAAACGISESRLYHIFKEELSTTPTKYRNSLRIEHAAADLRIAWLTIEDVAERNGFNSAAYFRETFKAETGMTPTEYRRLVKQ